jgi:hypothetical protein
VARALEAHAPQPVTTLAEALEWDSWGRRFAAERLGG